MTFNEVVFNFLRKALPGDEVENYRKAIVLAEDRPYESLNFILQSEIDRQRSLGSDPQKDQFLDFLECFRIGVINAEKEPHLAVNSFLKGFSSVHQFEVLEGFRKAFAAKENPDFQFADVDHLMKVLGARYPNTFVDDLRKALVKHPEAKWTDALSVGQVTSKKWLLDKWEELELPGVDTVFVLGGWYGILPALMFARDYPFAKKILSFDIDPSCAPIAETVNKSMVKDGWSFKATTQDMFEMNYRYHRFQTLKSDNSLQWLGESPDVVINTSCEHIDNFEKWYSLIPDHKLVILQSNNYFEEPTHVNCVKTVKDFQEMVPLRETLYAGTFFLEKYNRFMLIGRK